MVLLIASTFGHLHPEFLRFLWNFSYVDRDHPAIFDLYRTGEVRHGYCGTDDEATIIQKDIFLKIKARITSLVARSAAFRAGFGLVWFDLVWLAFLITLASSRLSTIIALCPPHTHTTIRTLCWFLRRLSPGGRPRL